MFLLLLVSILLHQQVSSSVPVNQPVSFSFPTFTPASCIYGNLICTGAVESSEGFLSLTSEPSTGNSTSPSPPLPQHKVGRVLYSSPVLAWPATFSSTFTIKISAYPYAMAGDGMSFILASDSSPSPPDSGGSFLGIMGRSPHGNATQLAVELDTFLNGEFDPDANHVGIDTKNMSTPIAVESLSRSGIELKSGRSIKVQIDYDGWTNMMYVSMGYTGSGYPLQTILEQSIVLSDWIPSSVYVGFTAATGDTSESHQVLDWSFTTVPLPSASSDSLKNRKLIH